MKNFLIQIATWIVAFLATAFMCASCSGDSDNYANRTMKGDTFIVIREAAYGLSDTLSIFTLKYKDNRMLSNGSSVSYFEVISNKNAFEVGDKVKLVKMED